MCESASNSVKQVHSIGCYAAAKLPVFPFPGHLTIKKGKYAAADVVGLPVWVEPKVNNVGVEVVLEIEWMTRSKAMQQREKTLATGTCRKSAKKNKAAKLTFQKDDQRAKLQVSKFTMCINQTEEL